MEIKIQSAGYCNSTEGAKQGCSMLGKQITERSVLSQGRHGSHHPIMPIPILYIWNRFLNYAIRCSCVFVLFCFGKCRWRCIIWIRFYMKKCHHWRKTAKGNRDTKQNAKLESLLAASLTIVVGDYHTIQCAFRASANQANYRTTDRSQVLRVASAWCISHSSSQRTAGHPLCP